MVDAEENSFYADAAPLEPHLIYQGEIIMGMPILTMPKRLRWLLLRTGKGGPIHEVLGIGKTPQIVKVIDSNQTKLIWENEVGPDGDYAMAQLANAPILVLSQTCDVTNNDFIQVAPIYSSKDEGYIGKLIRNEIIDAFYLPQHPPDWEDVMYADFEQIQAIHKSYRKPHEKEGLKEYRHFRLSPDNTLELQKRITRYFGRPNAFDAGHDRVPRTANYLCLRCFHWDGKVTSVPLKEGDSFTECELCKGQSWTIQLGSFGNMPATHC